jgi:hypothetical protein
MNTTSVPFQSNLRPELSLPRRGHTTPPIPMEPDDIVPKERRIAGPYGTASLQEAWDKLYKARAILEAEQNHLRDDRIALQGAIDELSAREQNLAAREPHPADRAAGRPGRRRRAGREGLGVHDLEADARAVRHRPLGIRLEEVIWRASAAFPP